MTSGWKRDEGYSGCKTMRYADLAVAITPDEGDGWGFQAFDEGDERALERGEYCYAISGVWSEEAAMTIAEMWLGDNC